MHNLKLEVIKIIYVNICVNDSFSFEVDNAGYIETINISIFTHKNKALSVSVCTSKCR